MNRIITLKRYFFTILLFSLFSQINAQKTEKFFDYKWIECKPNAARFYSITAKTDSGYCKKDYYIRERKLQMFGNYKDSLCQIKTGKFYFFHPNGSPESAGKYINNKKEGLWLSFYNDKMLRDSIVYLHDKQIGVGLSWYPNGYLSDSLYTNEDGSGGSISRFDNGSISSTGQYSAGHKQNGLWKYYHLNGKVSSLETYFDSDLIDKKYFDENGIRMTDTTNNDRLAKFSESDKDWNEFLGRTIDFPFNQRIINGDRAIVIVSFTINEDGETENIFITTSFSEKFDREVENAIKKSPQWYPAIEHNRKVKCKFDQTINFIDLREK